MVSPYDTMGSGLQQPTKGFDVREGEDLLSGLVRAPLALGAFGTSATPLIGSGTSLRRRQLRLRAAAERRKQIWEAAQQTNYHKGAIRYLQEVRGLTSDEVDQLLEEESNWQETQRNTRPERISRALVPAVHEEDRTKTLPGYQPTNSVTLPSGKTIYLDDAEEYPTQWVNDSFEDSPWQSAISDYTKFYENKFRERENQGFTTLQEYQAHENEKRQLNSYKSATDRIIRVNQDAAYSMESPIIRTQVEYMEALEQAKANGYPLGKVIEEERKHLSEGLYEIARTAIGQGMPIVGMEGEDYIERAQYMGEMMGWQGLVGMFLGWANSPIDTIKYKPNLPVMMFAPVMYRVARGTAKPATAELFASIEAKNPRFKAAMDKLRSGGAKVKDAAQKTLEVTGRITGTDKAFQAVKTATRKATDKLGWQRDKDGRLIIGYERAPARLTKGQQKVFEAVQKGEKGSLRKALDMVGPGELAPVTLGEGARRLIQSYALGYILGVEYEGAALSLARRSYQAIRTTNKGSAFMDYMRQNFSRSEGIKNTQSWARIKEAAEALREISEDKVAQFEQGLFEEMGRQEKLRELRKEDPDTPYEATGVEHVTPEGQFQLEGQERPIGYEATRGVEEGARVEPARETAADVIVNVDDVPSGARAKPDDTPTPKRELELFEDDSIEGAEARWDQEILERNREARRKEIDEEIVYFGTPEERARHVESILDREFGPRAAAKEKPTESKPEAVVEETPPASPPKGAGVEEVAQVFEVEPGVEIPYTTREATPAVSSWYKDVVRRAIRKVTGRAPTKAQLEVLEKSKTRQEVKNNIAETFRDIEFADKGEGGTLVSDQYGSNRPIKTVFRASDQRAAFFDEMLNREEGATPRSTPISPKKLETLKALRDRFGENLGTLFDRDYRDAWKKRPGNKDRRFNPTEEVLSSITDDGAIIASSPLAKLTRGERFSARGRGRQVKQTIIKEAEYADKQAKDAAAEVDPATGRQDMTDPNKDTLQIKLRETERDFERAQKQKSDRQLEIEKDKQASKEDRKARVEKDKASMNEVEGKKFKHSFQKLKEVAEALDDGLSTSTKGARSRKELVEKLAEDPQAVKLLEKFDTMKEKIGKYSSWEPKRYKTKKGKWVTPKKETIKSRKFRRDLLERYAKEVMRSNLPQKMKTRLLTMIQPNAKSSPFRQIKKDGKPGEPFKSLGSHLEGGYPYKNFIEEIEAAKKGEYAPEAFMGARGRPALLEAKKDIRASLKSIVDDWKAGKTTANKAIDQILDSLKEMNEDLALWEARGPTPEGATRGQVREITPKDKSKPPFRVQYVQPSYYGGQVRHRLASVELHKKNNRADFDSGRSRIHKDSYNQAAQREIKLIRDYMEVQVKRHLDMIRKDEKSSAARTVKAVLEESRGNPQGTLSPQARAIIKDAADGKNITPDQISSLPLLEGYAVRDLIDGRPKSVESEMNATRPATPAEVKQAKNTPQENGGVREINAESGTPKKELELFDTPEPDQPRPIVVGRPTTKRADDPFVRRTTFSNPTMAKKFEYQLREFLNELTSDRIGMTQEQGNAFAAGVFQLLKQDQASLLMSETMQVRVLESYIKDAEEVRTSTGKKVFNERDISILRKSIALWLSEFSSPFFAPDGPAPWLMKEGNKFAEMLTMINRTPGNLAVRLDKRRLVYLEDIRAKVSEQLAKMEEEGIASAVTLEAGKQATNNIKGRAVSKAFGRIIQRDLDRRGVTIDMTPAEAAATLAARELIMKEGQAYGLPNMLNIDGEIKQVTPSEIARAAALEPKAFVEAAEKLIGRKLSKEEIADYIGVRGQRQDWRKKESRAINSESAVGRWLNSVEKYKKLNEKEKGVEYEHSIFNGLMDEIPPKERELIERETAKVKEEGIARDDIQSEQVVSEAAYLRDTFIAPEWHESMTWNAALRKEIEAFRETAAGKVYGQVKRGSTMLSAKTSLANNLSHFVNLALLTGENPTALASRFAGTMQGLVFASNWTPKNNPKLASAIKEARKIYKEKFPERWKDLEAAIDMKLVNTTMVKAELGMVARNRKWNLGWWGDFREWYYGVGDSIPKTSEFIRQRNVIKQKMSEHVKGEEVALKTSAYTERLLRKKDKDKWEKLDRNDKFEEVSAAELDKMISIAAKVETDILIPDYTIVPRALRQARAGIGGKGVKRWLGVAAGLTSPFLSYPYLMLDGPNKPGWLTRTFLSRSYDGPIRSTNKGVKAREIASEIATAAKVALMFGQMSQQYASRTSREEKEAGRKAVRWTGKVGGDAPAYTYRGKNGTLRVIPAHNMHSGASPELAWGTLASSLMWAGDHIRELVEGKGLLKEDYEKLSYGDKLRYDALVEIEKKGGLLQWGAKRAVEVFAITGNHFSETTNLILKRQNIHGQDLTFDQAFVEAIAKIGPSLAPGGTDVYNAAVTAATIAAEAGGVSSNMFDARGGMSPYRNLVRGEEIKKEREYSDWTDAERMAFLIENTFASAIQIYAREIDIGLRHALVDGKLSSRDPKILNTYYRAFKEGYLAELESEIKAAKGDEKKRLALFRDSTVKPAFEDVKDRYDLFLTNLKEWLLRNEVGRGDRKRFYDSAVGARKRATEIERSLIRQRAAGYRLEKED